MGLQLVGMDLQLDMVDLQLGKMYLQPDTRDLQRGKVDSRDEFTARFGAL